MSCDDLDYLPDVLDEIEEEMLLDQPNKRCITGIRNYVMMKIMLTCGLSPEEILDLKWDEVDMIYSTITIDKKDITKRRTVTMPHDAQEGLENWSHRQRLEIGDCEYVFTTTKGGSICSRYIRAMVARYVDRTYISKDISPYNLRHTFGAKLYKKTGNIEEVKKALGLTAEYYARTYILLADEDLNPLY